MPNTSDCDAALQGRQDVGKQRSVVTQVAVCAEPRQHGVIEFQEVRYWMRVEILLDNTSKGMSRGRGWVVEGDKSWKGMSHGRVWVVEGDESWNGMSRGRGWVVEWDESWKGQFKWLWLYNTYDNSAVVQRNLISELMK